eukprot:COSAG02_NODE_609_length_19574_cov_18.178537_19_plen_288_part_00
MRRVLKTAGSAQQAAAGGAKKTARFSEIVAVKEVVYVTGDNFGDPFLGDSLGGSAMTAGERVKMQMTQYPDQLGQQAQLQGSAAAVRKESSARWCEMESDASGIWRFAQLRAERWRAEDDARRLRTEVERLRWQIALCRGAMEETAAVLDQYELEPPDELCRTRAICVEGLDGGQTSCSSATVRTGVPATGNVATAERDSNHNKSSTPDGSSSATLEATKSPRASAAAAAAARGILDQTARTPWLRTPDGVPVRIDWPVLAPRVLTALGIWLGATALVMRATNQSRK